MDREGGKGGGKQTWKELIDPKPGKTRMIFHSNFQIKSTLFFFIKFHIFTLYFKQIMSIIKEKKPCN